VNLEPVRQKLVLCLSGVSTTSWATLVGRDRPRRLRDKSLLTRSREGWLVVLCQCVTGRAGQGALVLRDGSDQGLGAAVFCYVRVHNIPYGLFVFWLVFFFFFFFHVCCSCLMLWTETRWTRRTGCQVGWHD